MKHIIFAFILYWLIGISAQANEYLPKQPCSKPILNNTVQEDELIKGKFFPKPVIPPFVFLEDELVKMINPQKVKAPKVVSDYDFSSIERTIIPIAITKNISSKNIQIGEEISFFTVKDTKINSTTTIPAKTQVFGIIEYAMPGQLRGEPGIIIVDKFKIKGFENIVAEGKMVIEGAKRNFWVLPLAKVINSFTVAGGYPLYLIRGGQAKISPKQVFELN